MLIALNQCQRRHHQRLAALALTLALCWLVFAARSALSERHLSDEMAACLAIAQTAALTLAVVIVAVARTGTAVGADPPAPGPARTPRSPHQRRPKSRT